MTYQIEKLSPADLTQYKSLMDNCFGGSNDIEHYKESYSENALYTVLVAKENEKIIGSITFYKIDLFTFKFQPALELFNVAVHKEYRNKGVAKAIFKEVIMFAQNYGYKSIYLTCLDSATPAHRLYESLGMKQTSSIKYSMEI